MDLDVIRKLNKEALMEIVDQSGYVEIARILGTLNLSGSELLGITEFQTINWKTTPLQRKQLLAFIKQLKANPSSLKTFPSKSKPQPFLSLKAQPSTPSKSQPSTPSKPQPSTPSKPQPSTPSKPQPSTPSKLQPFTSPKPGIPVNKRPISSKFPSVRTDTITSEIGNNQAFKQQLSQLIETSETQQKQGNALIPNRGKIPLPDHSNYNKEHGRFMIMGKSCSGRSQPVVDKHEMGEEELYENAKTFGCGRRTPDNYKAHQEPSPTILEDVYEPPPVINRKKNISPLARNEFPGDIEIEDGDGNDYEQIPNERQVIKKIWKTPPSSTFRTKISIDSQKSTLPEEDDYEPAPLHQLGSSVSQVANHRKPMTTPIREDLRKIEKKNNSSSDCLSLWTPHVDKASTDGNSANSNGRNVNRSKFNYENHQMKNENRNSRTWTVASICNRPLPAIPPADIELSLHPVDPQSSSTLNRKWRSCGKPPGYLETTKNPEVDEKKSSGYVLLTKNKEVNCYPIDDNQVYQHFDEASDSDETENCIQAKQADRTMEYKEEYKKNKLILSDVGLPKYKNNPPRDQQTHNQQKTTAAHFVNQLVSELSSRNAAIKQQDMNDQPAGNTTRMDKLRWNTPVTPPSISKKENFKISRSPLPKPPSICGTLFPVPRCPSGEFSDESDEEPEKSIFNINSEPYYRNTDRKGAKLLLSGLEDGAFLFRPSQRHFLVLTLKCNQKTYNLGIQRTKRNKIKLVADTESEPPEFSTLQDFVDHFTMEAVTFQDGEQLIEVCLKPVLPTNLY